MDFVDKIRDAISGHEDKIDGAIDQGGNFVDSKTDGKYAGHVDQGQDFLKEQLRTQSGDQQAPPN